MDKASFVDIYDASRIQESTEFIHVESMSERSSVIQGNVAAHSHRNLFQLIYAEKGRCTVNIDNRKEVIEGPCIIYIPGGTVHGFVFEEDSQGWIVSGSEKLFSSNQETRISSYIAPLIRSPLTKTLRKNSTEEKRIRWLIQELYAEFQSSGRLEDPAMEAMTKLLLISVRRDILQETDTPNLDNHKQQFFYRFKKLLESHFKQHLKVTDYAEQLGLTVTQLNKICLKYSGKTAHRIVQDRLILEAQRLLIYSDININQIGFDLGFKDPGYFNRFFKKHVALPPAKYREEKHGST